MLLHFYIRLSGHCLRNVFWILPMAMNCGKSDKMAMLSKRKWAERHFVTFSALSERGTRVQQQLTRFVVYLRIKEIAG